MSAITDLKGKNIKVHTRAISPLCTVGVSIVHRFMEIIYVNRNMNVCQEMFHLVYLTALHIVYIIKDSIMVCFMQPSPEVVHYYSQAFGYMAFKRYTY